MQGHKGNSRIWWGGAGGVAPQTGSLPAPAEPLPTLLSLLAQMWAKTKAPFFSPLGLGGRAKVFKESFMKKIKGGSDAADLSGSPGRRVGLERGLGGAGAPPAAPRPGSHRRRWGPRPSHRGSAARRRTAAPGTRSVGRGRRARGAGRRARRSRARRCRRRSPPRRRSASPGARTRRCRTGIRGGRRAALRRAPALDPAGRPGCGPAVPSASATHPPPGVGPPALLLRQDFPHLQPLPTSRRSRISHSTTPPTPPLVSQAQEFR